MKTMMQVQFNQFGSAEVLQVIEKEIPHASQGEVLIKVEAIGVNFSDVLRRKNSYFEPTTLPYVLGTEIVGIIVAIGGGEIGQLTIGMKVLAILPYGGGYSEYVTNVAQFCVPIPPSIDSKTATAIFVQGSTAMLMLTEIAKDLQNKTVLITAAAGGVGSILVQLASYFGATVIAATSTEKKQLFCTQIGAKHSINYSNPDWNKEIRAITNGKGVDIAFEMVGSTIYSETIQLIAQGGQMIVYGCASGIQGQIHPEFFVNNALQQTGFNLAYYIRQKPELWQKALGMIIELLAEGRLRIETSSTFSLINVQKAHTQLENRNTIGKVILLPEGGVQ
jgi:NADPH2:quinone reductase